MLDRRKKTCPNNSRYNIKIGHINQAKWWRESDFALFWPWEHQSSPPLNRKLYDVETMESSRSLMSPRLPLFGPQTKSHTTSIPGPEAYHSVSTATPDFLFTYATDKILWNLRSCDHWSQFP